MNASGDTEIMTNAPRDTEVMTNAPHGTEVTTNVSGDTEVMLNAARDTEVMSNTPGNTEIMSNGLGDTEVMVMIIIIIIVIAIQRRYSRFFTISPQRRELSPTRTLKINGPGAIVCKSRATYRALIACNMSCYMPLGTKGQLSY